MTATQIAQIAIHLNVAPNQVDRVDEWASVLFVVIRGIGARFVSKKVIQMVEVLKTASTWGGDTLILTSEKKMYIGRYNSRAELTTGVLIKEITDRAKGKSIAQMMDWHFDTFHKLPVVSDAPRSVVLAAGGMN